MQADYGIGCDIEEINRFYLDKTTDEKFLIRIFTPTELDYCYSFQNPAPHLACRFCAKEAVVKAFCSIGEKPPEYRCIEIGNYQDGVPFVTVPDIGDDRNRKRFGIRVCLSHSETMAMAVASITCERPVK
jgi:holo-[acyl-carrier protein] synthase